jgi:hypothetical protein
MRYLPFVLLLTGCAARQQALPNHPTMVHFERCMIVGRFKETDTKHPGNYVSCDCERPDVKVNAKTGETFVSCRHFAK